MPPNTVYVGRGSLWGNPFVTGEPSGVFPVGMGFQGKAEVLVPGLTAQKAVKFYESLMRGHISPEMYPAGHRWFEHFTAKCHGHPAEVARVFLKGKSLACWCSLRDACHADVLLEIANG